MAIEGPTRRLCLDRSLANDPFGRFIGTLRQLYQTSNHGETGRFGAARCLAIQRTSSLLFRAKFAIGEMADDKSADETIVNCPYGMRICRTNVCRLDSEETVAPSFPEAE